MGLLALMLLHESRRAARTSRRRETRPARRPGPLAVEPRADRRGRARWSSARSRRGGSARTRSRRRSPRCTPKRRRRGAPTGGRSSALYDVLLRADPSPVVELNRAVAVAMRDGPAAGLALIDGILARGELADYHLAHSARADLCRRLGRSGRGTGVVRAGAGAGAAGAGAAVSGAAARRAAAVINLTP